MALAIRMARGGRKGRPFYKIIVADKRMARDGRFIEKLGTYDPLLSSDNDRRIVLNAERIQYWLLQGAQPSDRVARFLGQAGIAEAPKYNETPKKSAPGAKALERVKEREEKAREAEEAAKAAAAAPAEEAATEEAPVEEAATEEAPAEEAAEEAAAETPAEEA